MLDVASRGCSEIAATYRRPMMGGADEVAKLQDVFRSFSIKCDASPPDVNNS